MPNFFLDKITFPDNTSFTSSVLNNTSLQSTGYNNGGISLYTVPSPGNTIGLSGENILYANPVDGGRLVIDGVVRQFNGFLTIDTTTHPGASANAINYVYAYWTGSTIALELSTAGHMTINTNPYAGLEVMAKTTVVPGSTVPVPSRTLVGMVYLENDKKIINNVQNRHILNWYNRRLIFMAGQLSAQLIDNDPEAQNRGQYTVEVNVPAGSAQYDDNDPQNPDNWLDIATPADNVISYLTWGQKLSRGDAAFIGISGGLWVVNSAINDRARIHVGLKRLGPTFPITSSSSFTGYWNTTLNVPITSFHNAHCISTISSVIDRREKVYAWAQMVGNGRAYVAVNSFAAVWG